MKNPFVALILIRFLCTQFAHCHGSNVDSLFNRQKRSGLQFPEGCHGVPEAPQNSHMQCSLVFGCKVKCLPGFVAPNGKDNYELKCRTPGIWRDRFDEFNGNIPNCQAACDPPCQNLGICISPGQCDCPDNFEGSLCQLEKARPCLARPPTPRNARVHCDLEKCDVSCTPNHEFADGTTSTKYSCVNGEWTATSEDRQFNDCRPICNPPCENGGHCMAFNQCQCPKNFKGLQCKYPASNCQAETLEFNGGFNCTGAQTRFTCVLNCPAGIEFERPPAPLYACDYATGAFSPPPPTPQCVYPEGVKVVRTKKVTTKEVREGYSDEGGSFLNWTWVMSGGQMASRWQSSLGQTWILGQGLVSGGGGSKKESSSTSVYNSEGKVNLLTLERYKKNVLAGGWWFSSGGGKFPKLQEDEESSQLVQLLAQHQSSRRGACSTWGRFHLRNFDGTVLSLPASSAGSSCAYTLARSAADATFRVDVEVGGACHANDVCPHRVVLTIQEEEYSLKTENGHPALTRKGRPVLLPSSQDGIVFEVVGTWVLVRVDGLGFHLKWNSKDVVILDIGELLWNKTDGLCGRHNGDRYDDFADADGNRKESTQSFAAAWAKGAAKGSAVCPPLAPVGSSSCSGDEAKLFCKKLLSKESLEECRKVLNPLPFYETCLLDICRQPQTSKPSSSYPPSTVTASPLGDAAKCESAASFVRQCARLGVDVNRLDWRGSDFCPLVCAPGLEYRACGSGESPGCDSSTTAQQQSPNSATDLCLEGCYCPTGTLLHKGRCVQRRECPCKYNGKEFEGGSEIKRDCNTCICQSGVWECSEEQCGRRCSAVGDPHYTTFDGKNFDFMGQCSYYMMRGGNYSVEVENVACSGAVSESLHFPSSVVSALPSCTKSATVSFWNVVVQLGPGLAVLVDGKQLKKLPKIVDTKGGKIIISKPSSLFVTVLLPNGLHVWWDGYARFYVDADASFRSLKSSSSSFGGLCGDFNGIQKDDFATPEGSVEQEADVFANSWRVDQSCDQVRHQLRHPCDANPESKVRAEEHCKKIQGEVFKDCHFQVDPEPFYRDCLYDLCSCVIQGDPKHLRDCLCPVLGHYGQSCAEKGAQLQWRNSIRECGVSCPASGQTYKTCGSSCGRTCADLSLLSLQQQQQQCRPEVCAEGCHCPDGFVLPDEDAEECVPVAQCSCIMPRGGDKEDVYEAGAVFFSADTVGSEYCVCKSGRWSCRAATAEERALLTKKAELVCDQNKNQVLDDCPPEVPETCQNMHFHWESHGVRSSNSCEPRCVCSEGFVLLESGRCVRPTECPCHHGRKSYREGETFRKDCNDCTCKGGRWSCSDRTCPSVCTAWGDSHYRTFDGRFFDFHGSCEYILARGGRRKADEDGFQIDILNVPCGTSAVTCSKAITLSIGVAGGNSTEKITLVKGRPIPEDTKFNRITVRSAGLFVFVEVYDLGLVLQWDGGNRLYVRVRPSWKGRLEGLCGNANGDQTDDFGTPAEIVESSARLFGDSWKLHKYCPDAVSIPDACALLPHRRLWASKKCTSVLMQNAAFVRCHSVVEVGPWLERCVFDACGCNAGGDCECLCTAVAAYAQECAEAGVDVKWRSQDICPMQCPPKSTYSSCIPTCPWKTCSNVHTYKALTMFCGEEACVEGCLPDPCNQSTEVYASMDDLTCTAPSRCRAHCLYKPDGTRLYEGDPMAGDECHTCFCSRGKRICTIVPGCSSGGHDFKNSTVVIVVTNSSTSHSTRQVCKEGWSAWINQKHPTELDPNDVEMLGEHLPLPVPSGSVAWCSRLEMRQIECRRASSHEPVSKSKPRDSGLISSTEDEVDCNLPEGLSCRAPRGGGDGGRRKCHDYEYRVSCDCSSTKTTVEEDISIETMQSCDPSNSVFSHPRDCHLYRECVEEGTAYGGVTIRLVQRSCGDSMMFNPETRECDWPHNVARHRPSCQMPNPVVSSTAAPRDCDPSVPHTRHPTDCQLFYHCAPPGGGYGSSPTGPAVLKRCGPGTLFHPVSMICDFGRNVVAVRPECDDALKTTPHGPIIFKSTVTPANVWVCDPTTGLFSLVNNPGQVLQDHAFSSSSFAGSASPASARFQSNDATRRSKRSTRVRNLTIKSIQFLTADHMNAGMGAGLFGIKALAGGQFYITVCGPKGCCESGHLDNEEDNWQRAKVDTFIGRYLGGCDRFDVGDSPDNGQSVEITLRHSGKNGCHLEWAKVIGADGTVYHCKIGQKLDGEAKRGYRCLRIAEGSAGHSPTATLPEATTMPIAERIPVWEPEIVDKHQWVQVGFEEPTTIYGVTVRGDSKQAYVTSYYVMYSWDGITYSYVENEQGDMQLFKGSVDPTTPVRQLFPNPVEARYIRINPQTWVETINLQVDIMGCDSSGSTTTVHPALYTTTKSQGPDCVDLMGLSNGKLSQSLISVSSILNGDSLRYGKHLLSLDSHGGKTGGGWKPANDDLTAFVKIDFTAPRKLTGIVTKGREGSLEWVEAFSVRHSQDGHHWTKILDRHDVERVFLGNHNAFTEQRNYFERVIRARYLKFLPLRWHRSIGLRLEVLGCFEEYPEARIPPTVAPSSPSSTCLPCPNVPFEEMAGCLCEQGLYWDGESCVEKGRCSCFVRHVRYNIGAAFENEDCEQCLCQSGGSVACSPKTSCPSCSNPRHHSEVLPGSCGCVCRECEPGTRLCPTGGFCIKDDAWCNGVDDCSDDERNCPTTVFTIEPTETTQTRIVTHLGTQSTASTPITTTEHKCKVPKCAPGFYLKETEIESLDGCTIYQCHSIEGNVPCPPVSCPPGQEVKFLPSPEAASTTPSSRIIFPGDVAYTVHPETASEEETLTESGKADKVRDASGYGRRRKRHANYGGDRVIKDDIAHPDTSKCPQYRCIVPSKITTTTPSSFSTAKPVVPVVGEDKCTLEGTTMDTFDGTEFKYDTCHHILAKDIRDRWMVTVHKQCSTSSVCRRFLQISQDNDVLTFHDDFQILYLNNPYTPMQMEVMSRNLDFRVVQIGESLTFQSKVYPIRVIWSKSGKVDLVTAPTWQEQIVGLCGFYNGNRDDDRQSPDGELTDSNKVFGDSWKVSGSENCNASAAPDECSEEHRRQAIQICKVSLRLPPLDKCEVAVSFDKFTPRCFQCVCSCLSKSADGKLQLGPKDKERVCRCEAMANLVSQCLAKDRNVDLEGWRAQHVCPEPCPGGQVYSDCHQSSCERSCQNLRDPHPEACEQTDACFPGCFCPPGLVKSAAIGGQCIPARQCRDCVCHGNQPGSREFTTFDRKSFSFAGNCSYVASKHRTQESLDFFEIRFGNEECRRGTNTFCTVDVEAKVSGGRVVRVVKSRQDPGKVLIHVDGKAVVDLESHSSLFSSSVTSSGNVVIVLESVNVEIIFQVSEGSFAIKMPSAVYGGKVEGMCGNCNLDAEDDIPGGKTLEQFIHGWATAASCHHDIVPTDLPLVPTCINKDHSVCENLGKDLFSLCHPLVKAESFVADCKRRFCQEIGYTICQAMERYAASCYHEGVCVPFRTKENCPRIDCPAGKEYRECPSHCPTTCQDVLGTEQEFDLSIFARSYLTAVAPTAASTSCHLEPQGCYCPDGDVLSPEGKCVEESMCQTCLDGQGQQTRRLGESWKEDSCTECTCKKDDGRLRASCVRLECPNVEVLCEPGSELQVIPGKEGHCCSPKHCVPLGEDCSSISVPKCKDNQVLRRSVGEQSTCPQYVCECIPRSQCSPPDASKYPSLQPGEELGETNVGCCPGFEVRCVKTNCPPSKLCPRHYSRVRKDLGDTCCPVFECEHPNVCLVYQNASSSNDQSPEEKSVVYQPYSTWQEGPCRSCICLPRSESFPTAECQVKECLLAVSDTVKADYEVTLEETAGECCPVVRKTACKHGSEIIRAGSTVSDPINPCKSYSCLKQQNGDILKQTQEQKCDTACPMGWRYVAPPSSGGGEERKCCGHCRQESCVREGKVLEVGLEWLSPDGCTAHTCVNVTGSLQILSKEPVCPKISDCEGLVRLDATGCCKICEPASAAHSNCEALPMGEDETRNLMRELHPRHGWCHNEPPIAGFKQCLGHCESKTVYASVMASHEASCTCCQTTEEETLKVVLSCEDHTYYTKEIKVPKKCSCLSCLGEMTTEEASEAPGLYGGGGGELGSKATYGGFVDNVEY